MVVDQGKIVAQPYTWVQLEGTGVEIYLSHPSSGEDISVSWHVAEEAPSQSQD